MGQKLFRVTLHKLLQYYKSFGFKQIFHWNYIDLEPIFWVLPNQTMQNCWKNYCNKLIIDLYNFYTWHLIDWAWFQCFYKTKPFQTKPHLQQSYCFKSNIHLNNFHSWHLFSRESDSTTPNVRSFVSLSAKPPKSFTSIISPYHNLHNHSHHHP